MVSRAEVEQYAAQNAALRDRLIRDMRAIGLVVLDGDTLDAALARFTTLAPGLVGAYGDLSSTLAADWFEAVRLSAGVPGSYTAQVAGVLPEQVTIGALKQALDAWGRPGVSPESLTSHVHGVVEQLTTDHGRRTVAKNVHMDPAKPRWARIPVGKTCVFCTMVASQGAHYLSKATASKQFHPRDDCVGTPIWKGTPYPEGYDPEALYREWQEAIAPSTTGQEPA